MMRLSVAVGHVLSDCSGRLAGAVAHLLLLLLLLLPSASRCRWPTWLADGSGEEML